MLGRGLATELVRESLAYAFSDLGLARVGAFVRHANAASVRELRKSGFTRVAFVPELERDEYHVSADTWMEHAAR